MEPSGNTIFGFFYHSLTINDLKITKYRYAYTHTFSKFVRDETKRTVEQKFDVLTGNPCLKITTETTPIFKQESEDRRGVYYILSDTKNNKHVRVRYNDFKSLKGESVTLFIVLQEVILCKAGNHYNILPVDLIYCMFKGIGLVLVPLLIIKSYPDIKKFATECYEFALFTKEFFK